MGVLLVKIVHTADADKTKLSCLVGVGGVNWVGDSRRQFSVVLNILETEQYWLYCPVSSAVWTHLWTSLDPVSKYDVTIGNHVACELETGSGQDKTRFTPHFETGQNCFEIFSCRQSWLVANSVHTPHADKTRQDSLVFSCELVSTSTSTSVFRVQVHCLQVQHWKTVVVVGLHWYCSTFFDHKCTQTKWNRWRSF